MHLTAGQTSALATFYNQCMNSLAASTEVAFTPTQEWIDKFAAINYFFYQTYATDGNNDRPVAVTYLIKPGKITEPWVPQNGEWVEGQNYFNGKLYEGVYIGKFEEPGKTIEHLIHAKGSSYTVINDVRPKPKKTQVPLAELLSVYASVKGLTQDGVELKPEN